jgi:hypothetical protein
MIEQRIAIHGLVLASDSLEILEVQLNVEIAQAGVSHAMLERADFLDGSPERVLDNRRGAGDIQTGKLKLNTKPSLRTGRSAAHGRREQLLAFLYRSLLRLLPDHMTKVFRTGL